MADNPNVSQEILLTLAKILSKGLTTEQRKEVLRGSRFSDIEPLPKTEFGFYDLLKSTFEKTKNLNFVEEILQRILATQSFYQDVGTELDYLRYKIKSTNGKRNKIEKFSVFVLMPFQNEFFATYQYAIKPTLEKLNCVVNHAEEIKTAEKIIDVIYTQIYKADFLIADATGKNPNVFYEIGYAHAISKKIIFLVQDPNDIPFDIRVWRYLQYSPRARELLIEDLSQIAKSVIAEIKH